MAVAREPRTSSFHAGGVGKTALGLASGLWLGKKLSALKYNFEVVETITCPLCTKQMQFAPENPIYPDGWYCNECYLGLSRRIDRARIDDAYDFAKRNEVSVLKALAAMAEYDPFRIEDKIEEAGKRHGLDVGRVMEIYLYRKWKMPESDVLLDQIFSVSTEKEVDSVELLLQHLKEEEMESG